MSQMEPLKKPPGFKDPTIPIQMPPRKVQLPPSFNPQKERMLWNPWIKKCKAIADLGNDEYKHMLCVDGAAIEKPIALKPGKEWTARVEYVVVPSTLSTDDLSSY